MSHDNSHPSFRSGAGGTPGARALDGLVIVAAALAALGLRLAIVGL